MTTPCPAHRRNPWLRSTTFTAKRYAAAVTADAATPHATTGCRKATHCVAVAQEDAGGWVAQSRLDLGSIGARSGLDLGSIYRYEIDRSTNTPLSPNADAICQKSMLYADVLGNWPGRCRVRGCCRVGRRTSSQVVSQRAVRLPDGLFFSRQCRVAAGCCQVCRVAAGARAQDAVAIRQEAAAAGAPPVYS